MSPATQQRQSTPELTIVSRVAMIPIVHDSIGYLDATLSASLLRSPYATSKALSVSALEHAKPLAAYIAPIITRADGFANSAVDAVESRYPYPFKTPTGTMADDLKAHADHARSLANKTVEQRVYNPAHAVVNGVDARLAPLVDYLASTLARLNQQVGKAEHQALSKSRAASTDAKYQYQRAYNITKEMRDQLYVYSKEQLEQLQAQSVIIQRASETAQNFTNLASSSIGSAQQRAHQMSDTMVQELKKVQASTAALPAHLQSAFAPVQASITDTVYELTNTLKSDVPLNDKVSRISTTVREHVTPVLDSAAEAVRTILQRAESTANGARANVNGAANGSAH